MFHYFHKGSFSAYRSKCHSCSPFVCCFISWHLRHPHWGNADGAEGIFWFCRTHVGCSPASGPTLKRPCAVLVRWWDGEQIKFWLAFDISYLKSATYAYSWVSVCMWESFYRLKCTQVQMAAYTTSFCFYQRKKWKPKNSENSYTLFISKILHQVSPFPLRPNINVHWLWGKNQIRSCAYDYCAAVNNVSLALCPRQCRKLLLVLEYCKRSY